MQPAFLSNITIDSFHDPAIEKKDVPISLLRLDKIHPLLSGNKWFKLRFHLQEAQQQAAKIVATFGGAWSNHLLATAVACKEAGLMSAGIVRGEEERHLSASLKTAMDWGMELFFVSRDEYRQRIIPDRLAALHPYVIDQGGYGPLGAAGAGTIHDQYDARSYSHTCCAVGTGTMMAGLINGAPDQHEVIGIPVLKNESALEEEMKALVTNDKAKYQLVSGYHFGGYAKYTPELLQFMNALYATTAVPTDFVYTGKLFFAIRDMVLNGFFAAGSRLLVIHSGGLSGNASLPEGLLIF